MSSATLAQRIGQTKEEAQKIFDTFFTEFPNVKKLIEKSKADLKKYGYVEDWAGRRRHLPDINLHPYEVKLAKPNADANFNPFIECEDKDEEDPTVLKWKKKVQEQIDKSNAFRRSKDPDWKDQQEMSNKAYDELAKEAIKEGIIIQANTGRIAQADRQTLNSRIQGGAASLTKLAMVNIANDEILKNCMAREIISVHDEVLVETPYLYAEIVSKRLPEVMINTAKPYINVPMSCDPYLVANWYEDNYTNAIQNEFEKLFKKNNNRDESLKTLMANHPELPEQAIKDCVINGKELCLEEYDN